MTIRLTVHDSKIRCHIPHLPLFAALIGYDYYDKPVGFTAGRRAPP